MMAKRLMQSLKTIHPVEPFGVLVFSSLLSRECLSPWIIESYLLVASRSPLMLALGNYKSRDAACV